MPTPTATSACCCGRPGKPDEAEAAYRTAIRLNPEHIDALHESGHPAVRPEATRRSGRLLLQGDHAAGRSIPRRAGCWRWRTARSASSTRRSESSRSGSRRSPTIRSPGTCCRRAPAATSRNARRTAFVARSRSTALPRASSRSWRKLSYRAPALVGAMLEDTGIGAVAEPRRARRGLRHRAVRSADSRRTRAG